MRVVVIGAGGFLGKQVIDILRDRGVDAVGLTRAEGFDCRHPDRIRQVLVDMKPRAIVNCAAHVGGLNYIARHAADVISDNLLIVLGLYRAVEQACPEALVINPIANCTYPGDASIQRESEWLSGPVHDSVLSFANARRMVYAIAACYYQQHGVRSVNWIVPNAYGPGDSTDVERVHALNGILLRMLQAQKEGDAEFTIWGSGTPVREWLYVRDAARVLVTSALAKEPTALQLYPVNIGQNRGYSINQIAELAARTLDYDVRLRHDLTRPDGAAVKVLDDEAFRNLHPHFEFTSLEAGIRETVAYYREVLNTSRAAAGATIS